MITKLGAERRIDTTSVSVAIRNADRNTVSTMNPVRMTD
jgi:hypothetical protein